MKSDYRERTLLLSEVGELNATTSGSFREQARAAFIDAVNSIDIDMSSTRLIDSSGLGALISLHKAACARGGAVRILHPTPIVQQILELTRLHRVFEIVSP